MIVNPESTSDIPRIAEPFFLNFHSHVESIPCLTTEDLMQAGLDELGQKWRLITVVFKAVNPRNSLPEEPLD